LRVDLSRGEVKTVKVDSDTVRQCIGGACLGAKLLYDEVPPGVEWDDPRNCLIIASGPLGGTPVPGSGTFTVLAKGAMTGGAGLTQANGYFGAYLRHSGFDAVMVVGSAPSLTYLYIHDGTAEIRDAAELKGKDTWETSDMARQEVGGDRDASVVSIGPAGENLVRFAGVFCDKGHAAAHNGVGAVMGSKNLKAMVAVAGRTGIPIKDGRRLVEMVAELSSNIRGGTADLVGATGAISIYNWGTLNGIQRGVEGGATLPVRNYTTNIYDIEQEELQKYSGSYIRSEFQAKRAPCFGCLMHHVHALTVPDGPHKGKVVDEPEYEGLAAWGPVTGQTDVTWSVVLNDLADRLGVDTNEGGWVVGLAMECFEKGIITTKDTDGLELTWGNGEVTYELLHRIARREGIGNILAEGAMRAAGEFGGKAPDFAVHSLKGSSPRGHDHRAVWSELFDTSVSNTGTLESGGIAQVMSVSKSLGLPKFDRFDPEGTATLNALMKGAMLFEDSLGICRFITSSDIKLLTEILEAATGWQLSTDDAMTIGRRAANRLRVFNLRHGIPPGMDRPSSRYGSAPVDGPVKGKSAMPEWDNMLRAYYEKMGWDENGIPLPDTLRDLGLADLIPHLKPLRR
ncbi:MAG: aldehyde ferredoxin oxidoreductase C-terminal domain-containing protein, partial [Dehalococcoidia bacterium]|nr:aldehyde ferredoxin oxidoreductase C-terminal domain-containing protein [Dehalococcoidia bacterium]